MTRRPVHAAGMVVAETTAPEGQPVTADDLHTHAWTARPATTVEAAVNARLTEQWPAYQAQLDAERLGHAAPPTPTAASTPTGASMETEADRRQYAEDDARFDRSERRYAAVMRVWLPILYVLGGVLLGSLAQSAFGGCP